MTLVARIEDQRRAIASQNLELERAAVAIANPAVQLGKRLAELRQHLTLQNDAGQRIGQHRFKAVTDLDAHLLFVGRDNEQRAIVGEREVETDQVNP